LYRSKGRTEGVDGNIPIEKLPLIRAAAKARLVAPPVLDAVHCQNTGRTAVIELMR